MKIRYTEQRGECVNDLEVEFDDSLIIRNEVINLVRAIKEECKIAPDEARYTTTDNDEYVEGDEWKQNGHN